MIYKKKNDEVLDMSLFENPSSEYRGAPFWGWNCELEENELLRQIDIFKKMGFGGFHIHPRSGLKTEYLGKKYMELVSSCLKKAKEEDMLLWLYDEDRWASGSAGGLVTQIKKYRQRVLLFSVNPKDDAEKKEYAIENGTPYLLNVFDICLNNDGTLRSYKVIKDDEEVFGTKWFVYCTTCPESGWYNNNTYVDSLSGEAIQKFIEITHEAYYSEVGEEFGKTIPAVFTDEPAHSDLEQLAFAHDTNDITLSWTPDFDESFFKEYRFDIKDKLPELVWNLENNEISRARYCYHNHISDRLVNAFLEPYGKWCREHNLILTGHMAEEDSLIMQTRLVGEQMRAYPHFEIPGIDMLRNKISLTTLKQAQSVVHQYGKEGMMAEHCGVTNWDFGFNDHKFHIDWLMALGVTARAHHGSWVSAKGCGKRDYPASINYHSPWYEEYSFIEDHASRIATVLTRGKPIVKVGVIHPIESMWLYFGVQEHNGRIQKKLDEEFEKLTSSLLFGTVDFDFISEALLENIYGGSSGARFNVGNMSYSAVVVPECVTLRNSTVEKLKEFHKNGGKLIFTGNCPRYIDAKPDKRLKSLYDDSIKVSGDFTELLHVLREERQVSILNTDGKHSDNLICNLREDGEFKWIFIAHAAKRADFFESQKVKIRIRGEYCPVIFDTLTGETAKIPFTTQDGCTEIIHILYEQDSLLLRLEKNGEKEYIKTDSEQKEFSNIYVDNKLAYTREEDNVYLLDMAQFRLDGEDFQPCDEIVHIDDRLRKKLGYPRADGEDIQPWAITDEEKIHYVDLKFTVLSEVDVKGAFLAAEEIISARLNECNVSLTDSGWYFDKSIRRYPMPEIPKGRNILVVRVPFGKKVSLENMFILGDFNVKTEGSLATILPKTEKIGFGSITTQGMPFYGGNIIYHTEIETDECELEMSVPGYKGALVKIFVDGEDRGIIACSPYKLNISSLSGGSHKIDIKLYGNRYNTFGALHNCTDMEWAGPAMWYPSQKNRCKEYKLKDTGIMRSPLISAIKARQ